MLFTQLVERSWSTANSGLLRCRGSTSSSSAPPPLAHCLPSPPCQPFHLGESSMGRSKAHRWVEEDLDESDAELSPAISPTPYLDAVRWGHSCRRCHCRSMPIRALPSSEVVSACAVLLSLSHVLGDGPSAPTIGDHTHGSFTDFLSG
jgi:hypothetical protein